MHELSRGESVPKTAIQKRKGFTLLKFVTRLVMHKRKMMEAMIPYA